MRCIYYILIIREGKDQARELIYMTCYNEIKILREEIFFPKQVLAQRLLKEMLLFKQIR